MTAVAAVDLGASGGRVMVGVVGRRELVLHEAHRFGNVPVTVRGTLHWDILRLYGDILAGLRAASGEIDLASVGIDSWGRTTVCSTPTARCSVTRCTTGTPARPASRSGCTPRSVPRRCTRPPVVSRLTLDAFC